MSSSAHVRSLSAVRDARAALLTFREDAASALDLMLMELQRAGEWIEHDRPAYWASETRRAFERVAATRTALNTCLMRTVASRRPSCIEEKQAHDAAKRRLEHCREQTERVRAWSVKLRHEIDEFRSRLAGLRSQLDGDVPKSAAWLERLAASLEAYAGLSPPPPEAPAPDMQDSANAAPQPPRSEEIPEAPPIAEVAPRPAAD